MPTKKLPSRRRIPVGGSENTVIEQKYRGKQVALHTEHATVFYTASSKAPHAMARVCIGKTFNTGEFTFLRLDVSFEIPCDTDKLEEAEAYLWEKAKLSLEKKSAELL